MCHPPPRLKKIKMNFRALMVGILINIRKRCYGHIYETFQNPSPPPPPPPNFSVTPRKCRKIGNSLKCFKILGVGQY